MIIKLSANNQLFIDGNQYNAKISLVQYHREGSRGPEEEQDDNNVVLLREERDLEEAPRSLESSIRVKVLRDSGIYARCDRTSRMIQDGKYRRALIAEKRSSKPEPFKARPLPSFFNQTLDNSTFMERIFTNLDNWNSQGKAKREEIEAKLSPGFSLKNTDKGKQRNKSPATDDVEYQSKLISGGKANELFLKLYTTKTKNIRSHEPSNEHELELCSKFVKTKLSDVTSTAVSNRLYNQHTISYSKKLSTRFSDDQNEPKMMKKSAVTETGSEVPTVFIRLYETHTTSYSRKKKNNYDTGGGIVVGSFVISEKDAQRLFNRLHTLQTKSSAAKLLEFPSDAFE